MLLSEIYEVTDSDLSTDSMNTEVAHLCTDSRQISFPTTSLFIALKSERRNGHLFIKDAYEKGVRGFLIEEQIREKDFPEAIFIQVEDTLAALQKITSYHRSKFNIPVIGITGSNGKTIIKEWLYQLLSPDFNICRSPRSYNSQIGAPLSVWQLHAQHQLAIFEAGISQKGEMSALQEIIKPSIGIFTNIGTAHDDGFSSREEKAAEKWKLFKDCETIICRTDYPEIAALAKKHPEQVLGWATSGDAFVKVTIEKHADNTEITIIFREILHRFTLPFTDEASVENSIHCIVACLHLGVDVTTLQARLRELHALPMRLEWKKGSHGSLLLNDSYSYDLTSLEIALHQLKQQAANAIRMAILSDLPGHVDEASYDAVATLLANHQIKHLFGIGKHITAFSHLFQSRNIGFTGYEATQSFIEEINTNVFEKAVVLIKGARLFAFEKIANHLQEQQHQTFLEINLSALSHNLNTYRGMLKPGTKMMVMLKAFGYGSTDAELGRWLQHHGTEYLAVAYTDEGVALREGGVTLPIMVMNPEPETFRQVVQYRLEPELYSFDILQVFDEYLTETGLTYYPVHLKIDTGMHRLGFEPEDLDKLITFLLSSLSFKIQSVFTHLVASENPTHDAFTHQQNSLFRQFTETLSQHLNAPFFRHAANTAAIARHPELHYDMVRLGIGLFGVSNTENEKLNLLPVSRLYTTVAQVKHVKAGESVGYGRHAVLNRDSRIATVRIGYADGYRRQLGNGTGFMYIDGNRAPVVGNVCMDMTMLDVTDLPEVKPGDMVEVFGEQISVNDLARLCNTIPYEIMTGISRRVKRVMVEE
jgi:Alr-MurF fusion protein